MEFAWDTKDLSMILRFLLKVKKVLKVRWRCLSVERNLKVRWRCLSVERNLKFKMTVNFKTFFISQKSFFTGIHHQTTAGQ
jgi:hypothetical protein